MSDFVLIEGDTVNFFPTFGVAVVVVQPGKLTASGPAFFNGKKGCVQGDEKQVSVPGCMYMTPQYSIPGVGTLKIAALAADQIAKKSITGNKSLLLKGSTFQAVFEVQSPAMQPPPGTGSPIPDAMAQYQGSGTFITTNLKHRAT